MFYRLIVETNSTWKWKIKITAWYHQSAVMATTTITMNSKKEEMSVFVKVTELEILRMKILNNQVTLKLCKLH